MRLYISLGSAQVLGLYPGRCPYRPTTLYLLLGEECIGKCSFCAQSRSKENAANKSKKLSRVIWPEFDLDTIADALVGMAPAIPFRRICIQTMTYEKKVVDILAVLQRLKDKGVLKNNLKNSNDKSSLPISVSTSPLKFEELIALKDNWVSSVTIPLDCASEKLFHRIKGRGIYTWEKHLNGIQDALEVFGRWNTGTHLIIGLGETDCEALSIMAEMFSRGVLLSLFAYTPFDKRCDESDLHDDFSGSRATSCTALQDTLDTPTAPPLERYRFMQIVREYFYRISRELISKEFLKIGDALKEELLKGFEFSAEGRVKSSPFSEMKPELLNEIASYSFTVRGCEGCNRPLYNEPARGPYYNYPYPLSEKERNVCLEQALAYLSLNYV